MCNNTQTQQLQKECYRPLDNLPLSYGYSSSLENLFEKHQKLIGTLLSNTHQQSWYQPDQTLPLTPKDEFCQSEETEEQNQSYSGKARLVRQIELQISLLESKSKQPGTKSHDLHPLGEQIYNKLDQYFISFGCMRNGGLQTQKPTGVSREGKSAIKKSQFDRSKIQNSRKKGRSRLTSSQVSRVKSTSSKLLGQEHSTRDEKQMTVNRKMYATIANLSVSSHSEMDVENEQRPFFQTKLSQSQLQGLEERVSEEISLSELGDGNQSYIELKQNIRVMSERIAFLIHRLQENKKEIVSLRQTNEKMEVQLDKQAKTRKQIRKILEDKTLEILSLQQENQSFQNRIQLLEKMRKKKEDIIARIEKELAEAREELDFMRAAATDKELKLSHLQTALQLKTQQYSELFQAFRMLEQEEDGRRNAMLRQIQDCQIEKKALKQTLKEYRLRVEVQGLSFNFEEAEKLKRFIEESDLMHQRELQKVTAFYNTALDQLREEKDKAMKDKVSLEKAVSSWIRIDQVQKELGWSASSSQQLGREFVRMVESYKDLAEKSKSNEQLIVVCEDRIDILKQQCQLKYGELQQLKLANKEQGELLIKVNKEKQQLIKYLNQHVCQANQKTKEEAKSSRLRMSKIYSGIVEIKLCKKIVETHSEMTLEHFIKTRVITSATTILKFGIKLIEYSEELQMNHKRKLPSVAPHSVLLTIRSTHDLDISFSMIAKKEEEEGLIYQAPEIVLGFAQSSSSHCWTIGIIIDEMLHGRKFFKTFNEILSHKDSYSIGDEKYRGLSVLYEMIKKNHKQRVGLEVVKARFQEYLGLKAGR